jgi:uncharacterized protein (DUF2141 family)
MTIGRYAAAAAIALSGTTLLAGQTPVTGQRDLPGQAQPQTQERLGSIWGTVVSGTSGQPVDGVRMQLSGEAVRGSRTVYSDDDGRFVFLGLPEGAYTLRGSKTGYVSITYGQKTPGTGRPGTPIQLPAGQDLKDVAFSLPPGGVITGVVFDEKNRPSVGTPVRIMRWSISSGERTLASAGSSTTDDRGIYRVYGLPPGEYLVSAMPRNNSASQNMELAMAMAEERFAEVQIRGLVGVESVVAPDMRIVEAEAEATGGYAPVYYPGTLDLNSATTVQLGVSQERPGVDFALQQIALARLEGAVIVPPDANLSSIQVRLYNVSERVPGVNNFSARVGRDGQFSFQGVPPGQYRAVATANVRGGPARSNQVTTNQDGRTIVVSTTSGSDRMWAAADVPVAGSNVGGITLIMQPGMKVSGRVVYDGAGSPPQNGRIRVTLAPFGQAASASGASSRTATVDQNGQFTVTGVMPAEYRVRATGAGGWSAQSAVVGGVDALDFSLVVPPGQDVANVLVSLNDQPTQLSGTLLDAMGSPTAEYTVLVYPSDNRYWVPQARRIQATRPNTAGRFQFSGLPPGDYRLAALTDVEPGAWYDPSLLQQLGAASVPFSLQRGQSATQDLKVGR